MGRGMVVERVWSAATVVACEAAVLREHVEVGRRQHGDSLLERVVAMPKFWPQDVNDVMVSHPVLPRVSVVRGVAVAAERILDVDGKGVVVGNADGSVDGRAGATCRARTVADVADSRRIDHYRVQAGSGAVGLGTVRSVSKHSVRTDGDVVEEVVLTDADILRQIDPMRQPPIKHSIHHGIQLALLQLNRAVGSGPRC